MENRHPLIQLFRYGLVGIITNITGYLLYLLITWLGVGPKLTMSVLYLAGTTISFLCNRRWTFSHQGPYKLVLIKYFSAYLLGYLINFFILYIFVDNLGFPHQLVQAAAVIIIASMLFITLKYFIFEIPVADGLKPGDT